MAPTIFIVPGIYEGTEPFQPLIKALNDLGHTNIVTSHLRSTGTSSKPAPGITAPDDVAAIAKDLAQAVEDAGDEGVVGFFHSAGGWVGSSAMKGLTAKERKAAGKVGGVRKVLFLASALLKGGGNKGGGPHLMPFMEVNEEEGTQSCKTPLHFLFHDLPTDEAEVWASKIKPQPLNYVGDYSPHEGWRDVPSVWFITEEDRMLPVAVQEGSANMAGGRMIRLQAGHAPMLSMPAELAKQMLENLGDE